jgi:hypothetical protein
MEMSCQFHASADLSPGKETLAPIEQEVAWALEPEWTMRRKEKSFAPTGNSTPTVQPVDSRYID